MATFAVVGWSLAAFCAWRWRVDRKLAWEMIALSKKWEALTKEAQADALEWKEAAEMWEREAGVWQIAALRPFRIRVADPSVLH